MHAIYDKRINPPAQPVDYGFTNIRVSKWTEDGYIYVIFGESPCEIRVTLSPKTACQLGWALLDAEGAKPRLEPDEHTDPVTA